MIPKRQKTGKELQLTAGRKFLVQGWVSKAEARSVPQTEDMGLGVHGVQGTWGSQKNILQRRETQRERILEICR